LELQDLGSSKDHIKGEKIIEESKFNFDNSTTLYKNLFSSPVAKRNQTEVEVRTPTLEDFGISASTLQAITQFEAAKELANQSQASFDFVDTLDQASLPTTNFFPSPQTIVTPKSQIQNVGSNLSEEIHQQTLPSTGLMTGSCTLIKEVSAQEFSNLTSYLKSYVPSLENLNNIVNQINEFITDKRFNESEENFDFVTEIEARDVLKLGNKSTAIFLLLQNLKRVRLAKKNQQT